MVICMEDKYDISCAKRQVHSTCEGISKVFVEAIVLLCVVVKVTPPAYLSTEALFRIFRQNSSLLSPSHLVGLFVLARL